MDSHKNDSEHFMASLATFLSSLENKVLNKAKSLTKVEMFGVSLEWHSDNPPPHPNKKAR